MQQLITLLLLLTVFAGYSQSPKHKLTGKFSDDITALTIKADSTFELVTPDYVFPNTFKLYQNRGVWTYSGNLITLNPQKEKRIPTILLTEKQIQGIDSVLVKINYLTEIYENEILISKAATEFELLTLYLNKPKNYHNLVHAPIRRICAFAPRIKKQMILDSSNLVRLPKQKVESLGIYTYGFEKPIEIAAKNPNANYFEITIVQPVDKERMPRSKQVIIKEKSAYFYESEGNIPTSGLFLNGLKRTE